MRRNSASDAKGESELKDADFFIDRGISYDKAGMFSEAIDDFNQALKMNFHSNVFLFRGHTYFKQNNLAKAIADFCTFLHIMPWDKRTNDKMDEILKDMTPDALLAEFKKLPREREISLLRNALNPNTKLGKKFREKNVGIKHFFGSIFYTKDIVPENVKRRYQELTRERANVRTAARMVGQGCRTYTFFGVPREVGIIIASKAADYLPIPEALEIAREHFDKPEPKLKAKK